MGPAISSGNSSLFFVVENHKHPIREPLNLRKGLCDSPAICLVPPPNPVIFEGRMARSREVVRAPHFKSSCSEIDVALSTFRAVRKATTTCHCSFSSFLQAVCRHRCLN